MYALARRTDHLLRATAAYPLALTSAAAVVMIALRAAVTDTPIYIFLIKNLILAWIPFVCGLVAFTLAAAPRRRWAVALLAGLWLIFLPNAPYLVTDIVHLRYNRDVGWWYDLVLLALCAWTGMLLAVFSLRLMQLRVASLAGRRLGWLFAGATIALGSVGVAIGRFLRWNSWDLLLRPQMVASDFLASAATEHLDRAMLGLSGGVALLWLLVYLALATAGRLDDVAVAAP
jgi:uncharacterized membrane protein